MKRSAFLKIAGSSLILGGTIAGCASTAPGTHTASASDNDGAQYAAAAAKALSQDKDGKAIVAAEEAVAANPQDGAYRSLLGQAYRSEEHTSELQSLMRISYAVFCLKKKKTQTNKRRKN